MGALKDKQEIFCKEYLKDLNGTQAAIRAGYSEKTANRIASEILSKPVIRTRIKELMDERSKNILIDSEYVVSSLINVATRCQQGEPVMVWDPEAKCMKETGEWQFDSTGANRALELIGKHLGMFTEKVQHSGNVNTGGVNEEQFAKLLEIARSNARTAPGKGK
ncbi:terminase small subunit [Candidatus Dependentiae bacterium]|nr:terminase small subunit [Candidatus Dependentiae bacterium]